MDDDQDEVVQQQALFFFWSSLELFEWDGKKFSFDINTKRSKK